MKKSAPIPETLAGMYGTNIPFLEGNPVPVIKRKFNWIPTGGKGDPPRALTDVPPLKTHFYEQVVVKSDFPKTMAYRMYGDGFAQMPDGTYNDAVMGVDRDNEELQKSYKQLFAPSDVYMFMRADREQYTQEMMKDYFRSKYEEKQEREEMFLEREGLLPHEIKTVMAERKIESARKALERAATTNRLPVYQPGMNIRREDLIADRFMNNTLPLFSMDDARGVGNAQPWAHGHEDWTRGYDETTLYARKTPGAAMREARNESAAIAAGMRKDMYQREMESEKMAEKFRKEQLMKRAMKGMKPEKDLLSFSRLPVDVETRGSMISEIDVPVVGSATPENRLATAIDEGLRRVIETTGGKRDLSDMPKSEYDRYKQVIDNLNATQTSKERKAQLMAEISSKFNATDAAIRKKFDVGSKWGGGKTKLPKTGGGAGGK
jgi:hypothetical protein